MSVNFTTSNPRTFVVVGAGLGGALLACYLADMGHRVRLFERRPDPRENGFIGGRSINLALSTRGITGLKGVGLDQAVLEDAIPMRGRMLHDPDGEVVFQAYSKDPTDAINSVSRAGLNITLLNAAAKRANIEMRFGCRCLDVDLKWPRVTFRDEQTGEAIEAEGDAVIGADGAFSAIRAAMQRTDRFNYEQSYLSHGYKELTIPPTESGEFAIDPNALHIWPRGANMMIALPNKDRSFTCTLFWPFDGEESFERITGDDSVRAHFEKVYPDAPAIMPTLLEDFRDNPVSSLVTIRCRPWNAGGKVALLGDAAHAIVPFYGQGMNAAFEDCRVLAEQLASHDDSLEVALDAYACARHDNADAIADMALTNFVEMRDKTASTWFRLRKKLETTLHKLLPDSFLPLYNMVSFSNIPYAEALGRARRQARVIEWSGVGVAGLLLAGVLLAL
ncbi:MAG: NAD(P)/FAD-dependent oxidoreductase [Planctomycetota bacterium]